MRDDRNEYDGDELQIGATGRDQAWPGAVQWDLGAARGYAGELVWRCEATRAGKLYSRSLFGSRFEAERFAVRMRQTEPDQMFSVEAIRASAMWN